MLRASFSFTSLRASAEVAETSFAYGISFASAQGDYAVQNTEIEVACPKIKSVVSYSSIQQSFSYADIVAAYLLVSETLNQFLTDSLSIAESAVFSVTKAESDSISVTELSAKSLQKPFSDNVSVSEQLSKVMSFSRSFSESVSFADVRTMTFEAVRTELINIDEALSSSFEASKSDQVSPSDAFSRVVTFSRSLTESVSVSEQSAFDFTHFDQESLSASDDPTKAFSKSLTDAFTLDDLANIGDLEKNTSLDKGNVFSMSEVLTMQAQKAVSDTLIMQEQIAKSFATSFSDDTSVTESITVVLTSGINSVFNDGVFNAFAFNE